MGFAAPTATRVNLKDYQDTPIALQFVSDETGIVVHLPGEDAPSERDATRARIAVIDPQGNAEMLGETLVFYEVVARNIREHAPDWVIGKLQMVETDRPAPDGTNYRYFQLVDLSTAEFTQAVTALRSIGLS